MPETDARHEGDTSPDDGPDGVAEDASDRSFGPLPGREAADVPEVEVEGSASEQSRQSQQ